MNKLIVQKRNQEPAKPKESPQPQADTSKTDDAKQTHEESDAESKETKATAVETPPEPKPDPVSFAALSPETRAELEQKIRDLFRDSSLLEGWFHFGHL